jgi:hypothetical protein
VLWGFAVLAHVPGELLATLRAAGGLSERRSGHSKDAEAASTPEGHPVARLSEYSSVQLATCAWALAVMEQVGQSRPCRFSVCLACRLQTPRTGGELPTGGAQASSTRVAPTQSGPGTGF